MAAFAFSSYPTSGYLTGNLNTYERVVFDLVFSSPESVKVNLLLTAETHAIAMSLPR
jgi:hypothetical protein